MFSNCENEASGTNSKTRNSFFIVLILRYLNVMKKNNSIYHTNKGKSSLTSLAASKPVTVTLTESQIPELTEEDMPVVLKNIPLKLIRGKFGFISKSKNNLLLSYFLMVLLK